jgi:hypothetical protein
MSSIFIGSEKSHEEQVDELAYEKKIATTVVTLKKLRADTIGWHWEEIQDPECIFVEYFGTKGAREVFISPRGILQNPGEVVKLTHWYADENGEENPYVDWVRKS